MPDLLYLSVPEGYAFYGLYPESYAEAVAAWASRARPAAVLAVGLRSIGASLSAIVVGALRLAGVTARSWTLRPRGDPFNRHIALSPDLARFLDAPHSHVLIVDEGPGLSGSSMAGAAAALGALGVPEERVIFVPSWDAPANVLLSDGARAQWRRHALIAPSFDRVRAWLAADGIVPDDAIEISAGAWRATLGVPNPWPAAHPQHERRKYLTPQHDAIVRFAGLGAYGRSTAERAEALGAAGWTSGPVVLRRGFLHVPFVPGRPMGEGDCSGPFIEHAVRYVAWRRANQTTTDRASLNSLSAMLEINTREALGSALLPAVDALAADARTFDEPATCVDGRMAPHEWISTTGSSRRWIKTDAFDHCRDHFLPGPTDAAWDVAGLTVEFGLDARDGADVAARYAAHTGDHAIHRRLPFFVAAYAAFRCGYARMAAATLSATEDGRRFGVLEERYRRVLAATLAPSAR